MRKFLIGSVVTALLLALFTVGCDLDTNDSDDGSGVPQATGYSIETPVVSGKSYPGVNRVSWLPISDAKSYDLIRKDNSDGSVKTLVANQTPIPDSPEDNFYYDDVVSADNRLVNGHTYTYTVIAYSGYSFNGRAFAPVLPPDGTLTDPVLNTQASVDITANIPSPITYKATPPAVDNIELTTTSSIDQPNYEYLDIRWPAIPTFGYRVKYTLGDETGLGTGNIPVADINTTYVADILTGENENVFGHARFPLIAGRNTVQIQAFFLNKDRDDVNNYYSSAAPVSKAADFDRQVYVPTVAPGFSAAQYFDYGGTYRNGAVLSWIDVPEATDYVVYKLASIAAENPNTQITLDGGVWTLLDIGKKVRDGDEWSVVDTDVVYGKAYSYLFVVKYGELTSLPTLAKYAATGEDFTAPALNHVLIHTDTVNAKVELQWTARPGETYLITRQEIEFDPAFDTYAKLEDAVMDGEFAIAGDAVNLTPTVAGLYVQLEDDPGYFKSYRYELRAQKDGLTSKPYAHFVFEGPYNKLTDLSVFVSRTDNSAAIDQSEYTIGVTVSTGTYAGHLGAAGVQLFRREVIYNDGYYTPSYTDYLKIKDFTAAELLGGEVHYLDKGLDPAKTYQYKVIGYNGTTILVDDSPYNNESGQLSPSNRASVIYAWRVNQQKVEGNSGTTLLVALDGINLKGVPITVARYYGTVAPVPGDVPQDTRIYYAVWDQFSNRYTLEITGLTSYPLPDTINSYYFVFRARNEAYGTGIVQLGLGD